MNNLKQQLIRLGNEHPHLRSHLRPILDEIVQTDVVSARGKKLRMYDPSPGGGTDFVVSMDEWIRDNAAPHSGTHPDDLEAVRNLNVGEEINIGLYILERVA